jgi:hypothetical protein
MQRLNYLLVMCAAALAACAGSKDTATRGAFAAHAAISDSLTGPGTRDGTWNGTDQRATWHAILDGPRITQLDEVALYTDSARAMRQFTFDSAGTLATAREEREQLVYGATALPDTIRAIIELEWANDSLVRSAKKVNGAARMLQPYEVDNIRAHATELVRSARAGAAAPTAPAKP